MNIDLSALSSGQIYHLMTQTIIPRPIAWVLSKNTTLSNNALSANQQPDDDSLNLAPFSYFNAVSSDPPLCMLSMGKKPDGKQKDTATNLQQGAMCIVHIAHAQQSKEVTDTAATLEYGVSEVELNNIDLVQHNDWTLKRIANCPIAFLCKVHSTQEIGNAPQLIVFIEILEMYISDNAVSEKNSRLSVDALKVNPLSRLGANQYASLGDVFNANRPK